MPRNRVQTTYRKTDGGMKKDTLPKPYHNYMKKVEPLSQLAQFVEDNQEEGISSLALLRGFQETHKHGPWKVLCASGHYNSGTAIHECSGCGALKVTGRN